MKKVLLDTNFLLIPEQFRVDIFSELDRILGKCELFTLDENVRELEKLLKEGSSSERKSAKIALALVKKKNVSAINTEKTKKFLNSIKKPLDVDSLIVEFAKKGFIIATQDIELKRRLKNKAPMIILRKKKYLSMI